MIRLIAAIDRGRGIAKGGLQPWHITEDEHYFRDMTYKFGANVLMGHTTYDVIGHPLEGRSNFVLASDIDELAGVEVVKDLDNFLAGLKEDLWIIGGASVFEQTIIKADELYLTHIDADFGCDQFFPLFADTFQVNSESELHEENGFIFKYTTYQKR